MASKSWEMTDIDMTGTRESRRRSSKRSPFQMTRSPAGNFTEKAQSGSSDSSPACGHLLNPMGSMVLSSVAKSGRGFTAAGTVPDLHRVPHLTPIALRHQRRDRFDGDKVSQKIRHTPIFQVKTPPFWRKNLKFALQYSSVMKTLRMYATSINDRFIDDAVKALRDGSIIVYPTDTMPAVGCDALRGSAVDRLCRIQGIDPRRRALSVVCSDISMASEYARIDNEAYRILRRNLPGPFTFILPAATTLPKVFKGRREVGIRVPDSPIALALAERLGGPLLSSSAIIDGEVEEIYLPELGARYDAEAEFLIDDGVPCSPSLSTVVDLTDSSNPVIVREGAGILE